MHLRVARHTNQLPELEKFYTEIIGLKKLGEFKNHSAYDGIFLGLPHHDWHIEFTCTEEKTNHHFDEDDCLVFYVHADAEMEVVRDFFLEKNIRIEKPKNPYWQIHGIQISDPDGYKIIYSIKEIPLAINNELGLLLNENELPTWNDLLTYVRQLPYGRNSRRDQLSLVLSEAKGTCSSKHALLKTIANDNELHEVKLILGIFKMNAYNTPKIKEILSAHQLEYIPEAHCYLKINEHRIDLTYPDSKFSSIKNDLLLELEIEPEQVFEEKITIHKNYIQSWLETTAMKHNLDEIWKIRESCIQQLTN